jgi:S-adenosylmethionine decarboxylase proenzyme
MPPGSRVPASPAGCVGPAIRARMTRSLIGRHCPAAPSSAQPGTAADGTVSSHIMPAKSLSGGGRPLFPPGPAGMVLYAVDAVLTPGSPVSDIGQLAELASDAVAVGGGHVLDTSHVTFPNGAVTLVLILAESHLAIHTWPEDNLVAIDLFSCGAIDGPKVAAELARLLRLDDVRTQRIERGTAARR